MQNYANKLFEILEKIRGEMVDMKVQLEVNTNHLADHIKRTEMLEQTIDYYERTRFPQLERELLFWKRVLTFITSGTFLSVIVLLLRLLKVL